MVNVYALNVTSICIHGEELLRQFTFHQKYRRSHEIFGVGAIDWVDSSWKHFLWLVAKVVSLPNTKVYVFSDSVQCLGEMDESQQSN